MNRDRSSFQNKKMLEISITSQDDDESDDKNEFFEHLTENTRKETKSPDVPTKQPSKSNIFTTNLQKNMNTQNENTLHIPETQFSQLMYDDFYQEAPTPKTLAHHFQQFFENFDNCSNGPKQTSFDRLEKAHIFQMKKRGMLTNGTSSYFKRHSTSSPSEVHSSPTLSVGYPSDLDDQHLPNIHSHHSSPSIFGEYKSPSDGSSHEYFLTSPSPTKPTKQALATRLSELPKTFGSLKLPNSTPERCSSPDMISFSKKTSPFNTKSNICRSNSVHGEFAKDLPKLSESPQNFFHPPTPTSKSGSLFNTVQTHSQSKITFQSKYEILEEATEIVNFFGYQVPQFSSLMDGEMNISNPFTDCLVFLVAVQAKMKEKIKKFLVKLEILEQQKRLIKEESKRIIATSVERRSRIIKIIETFLLKYPAEIKYVQAYYEEIVSHFELIFGSKPDPDLDLLKRLFCLSFFLKEKIKILRKVAGLKQNGKGNT